MWKRPRFVSGKNFQLETIIVIPTPTLLLIISVIKFPIKKNWKKLCIG